MNPFARRGNGVSTGNLGASISAADKSETPRMGNSNAQDNTYKNNDNKEVDSDGFLLDSDLETEDDDGQSASKKLTPTQKRIQEVNKAMDKLIEAHKNKDLEKATQIWEWAEDNGHTQVLDKHIQLFGE